MSKLISNLVTCLSRFPISFFVPIVCNRNRTSYSFDGDQQRANNFSSSLRCHSRVTHLARLLLRQRQAIWRGSRRALQKQTRFHEHCAVALSNHDTVCNWASLWVHYVWRRRPLSLEGTHICVVECAGLAQAHSLVILVSLQRSEHLTILPYDLQQDC